MKTKTFRTMECFHSTLINWLCWLINSYHWQTIKKEKVYSNFCSKRFYSSVQFLRYLFCKICSYLLTPMPINTLFFFEYEYSLSFHLISHSKLCLTNTSPNTDATRNQLNTNRLTNQKTLRWTITPLITDARSKST